MDTKFSEKLLSLLKERGMKQVDLASKTGITPQSISKYINGGSYPDMDSVVKISDCLNVSIDDLFGRDISPLPASQKYSRKSLLRAFVIAADELGFDVESDEFGLTSIRHNSCKKCSDISEEADEIFTAAFFSSWVKYRDLLKHNDITKEEYDSLLQSRLDREFPI